MKKLLVFMLASSTLLVAGGAFAGPPALAKPRTPCSHCLSHGEQAARQTSSRSALYGPDSRPCPQGGSIAARWGQGQKPCPRCSHKV